MGVESPGGQKVVESRRHPDLFSEEEAIAYLHLDPESGERTMVTFRGKGLVGVQWGKSLVYTRSDLDAFVAAQLKLPAPAGRAKSV